MKVKVGSFREFKQLHSWFHRESKKFVGVRRDTVFGYHVWEFEVRDIVYYPVAWVKFMWHSRRDIWGT